MGTFAWADNGRRFTFTPTNSLIPEHQYTVRITSSAADIEGNAIDKTYTFSFTTQKDIEVIAWIEIAGHFFEDWQGAQNELIQETAPTAPTPLHVQVKDYNMNTPIEGATVSVDGISYGQTDNTGHIKIPYKIPTLPIEGQYSGVIEVITTSGLTGKSNPLILYEVLSPVKISKTRSGCTIHHVLCTLSCASVGSYGCPWAVGHQSEWRVPLDFIRRYKTYLCGSRTESF